MISIKSGRHNYELFLILVTVSVLLFGNLIDAAEAGPYYYDCNLLQGQTEISLAYIIPGPQYEKKKSFLKRFENLLLGKEPPLFSKPVSVTAADTSLIWVADQGYGEVIETGTAERSSKKLFSTREKRLPSISGICRFGSDSILFTDSGTNQLYLKFKGSVHTLFNENLILDQPTGIAISPVSGEIWVIETRSHRVAILDRNGNRIRTIGNRGTGRGEFNYPTHIWIDSEGKVYIVDALNFRIQIFDSAGRFLSLFGEQGDATGYFARPKGIATDSAGNIYIADALFHTIQVFDKQGTFLHYFGEQGNSDERFWMPSGIFIDKNDFLYIADSYNSRVKVYKIDHK